MNKLALSTTFEEWFKLRNRNKSMLRGCLLDDIGMLEHDMILERFLPELPSACAYCFERNDDGVSFVIKSLRSNYLYTIGRFSFICYDGYCYHYVTGESYSEFNGIEEVFENLFNQMLAYYEKHNIGTNRNCVCII